MKPYFERGGIRIFCGRSEDVLPILDVDAVVTDPPYGTGGWRRRDARRFGGSIVQESWDDGAVEWLGLARARYAAVFWPAAKTRRLLSAAEARGWDKHRALYYQKVDPMPLPGGRTRWSVEPIWVLSADGLVLLGETDWHAATAPRANRDSDATGHPYQKPLGVMIWLLSKFARGSLVDPFMGSGTTLEAALSLGWNAAGIEQEERWCEVAARRLGQMPLDLAIHAPSPAAPHGHAGDLFGGVELDEGARARRP